MNVYKELRKEKGLTQIELAQRFQIDQTTVSKWELGRAIPDVSMLCKLSDFFDVSVDYLLGRTQFYYPDNIKSITTDAPNNKNENDSACANNMHNYGAELKYQRELAGLNQPELALKIGTSQANISRWERGEVLPNIDFCVQLANCFGVTLEELLGIEYNFCAKKISHAPNTETEGKLNEKEKALLEAFGKLLPETQDFILRSIQSFVKTDSAKKTIK